jgi:hypothetical protein
MAEIFISWGLPDAVAVQRLTACLRDLGLDIWEYSHDMNPGNVIPRRVNDEIRSARMAIICLSDKAAARDWITTEVAWCYDARRDGTMKDIVPVRVGPLSEKNVPHLLGGESRYVFDLTRGDLERLADGVVNMLGREAPVTVPAALFAMTEKQSLSLFKKLLVMYNRHKRDSAARLGPSPLWDLCLSMGMDRPPALFDYLKKRYGATPHDLSPFESNKTLVATLNELLREVNTVRLKSRERQRQRPIILRWMTDELVGPDGPAKERARQLWRDNDSLLIIDSVSTFYEDIRRKLLEVPASNDPSRAAVLWVPPYTQHTTELEATLERTAQIGGAHVGDVFSDWKRLQQRPVSFDAGTSVSLRFWLRRTLNEMTGEQNPLEENFRNFDTISTPGKLRKFLQPQES